MHRGMGFFNIKPARTFVYYEHEELGTVYYIPKVRNEPAIDAFVVDNGYLLLQFATGPKHGVQ